MARRIFALIAVLALMTVAPAAQDARAVLQAAAKAMGADTIKTIEISGTGMNAAVGQSFAPGTDWPHFEVTSYTRTIDYENRASREQLTRRQGNYPAQGGGGTPLQGEQQQHAAVSGNAAWNVQGTTANPAPAAAEVQAARHPDDPTRVPQGGPRARRQPDVLHAHESAAGTAWPQGDGRLVHGARQVQGERRDQRSEPGRVRADVDRQSRPRRHAVRDPLHAVQGFQRGEVSRRHPYAPGRSAAG